MRLLIYGGSGYIGRKLISLLYSKGFIIANVGRNNLEYEYVTNYSFCEEPADIVGSFLPDTVIYLTACFDNKDIDNIINVNITMPLKVLDALRHLKGTEFIYIGSYWQFGDAQFPDVPIDVYSSSKKAFSVFLEHFFTYSDIRCKEVVLYGSYGKSDSRGKVLDHIIDSARSKKDIELTDGYQKLNLVDVEDIASSIESLLNTKESGRFSILSSREYTLREIASLVVLHTKCHFRFGVKPYREVELMNPLYPNTHNQIVIKDVLPEYIKKRLNTF